MAKEKDFTTNDMNRDPITGAPGAHPVGTGVGAAGGAVAGAAAGAVAGPVGAVVGLVAGGLAGGLGGKAVAESVNPTAEEAYWRSSYDRESYYEPGRSYDDYAPAYALGWSSRAVREDSFDTLEPTLADEWATRRGNSTLDWPQARHASRAAWVRADRTYFGEAAVMASRGTAAFDADRTTGDAMSNDDVVDVLNDLIENSHDGEYGFRTCAEEVENASLKQVFAERAAGCRTAANELAQLVTQYGGTPADGGTTSGAMHRGWVHVKGAVGANSEASILNECERGEDAGLARYRKALKQALPADVRAVIERQAQGAQRNHDQIKALRDQARARS
ncbi:ferritin-like domain-containing protein [Variovorax sp. N23]|uniref:ferritin-like domain-containing protein n=1 Tax=Variovorax sp. N23 TaxID=2980555 RepID=UPI0021C57DA7|nr:PA2169 family four-helix-bundle protein [Variovorax sp. N23]MCU4119621.1 PA2169 family four-helix-bundle protein [Variovorax sp. N23]